MSFPGPVRPTRTTRPGRPWLFPLLVLPLAAVFLLGQRHGRVGGGAAPPAPPAHAERVAVLGGTRALADGRVLRATLSPLEADPHAQAFAARAFARRLGIEPAEPWRLVIEWLPAPGLEGSRSGGDGAPRGEPVKGTPPAPAGEALAKALDPAALSVRGAQGGLLAPLPAPSPPAPNEPADPLVVLLAPPPAGPSATAQEAAARDLRIVLFGSGPRGEARLLGLPGGPLILRSMRVAAERAEGAVARWEREGTGDRAVGVGARSLEGAPPSPAEDGR